MHVQFGDYHVRDIEFVAAFDVDAKKVGFDLAEAIGASENNTIKICRRAADRRHRAARAHPRRPRQVLPRDDRGVRRRAGRRRRGAARRAGPTCWSATCRSAPRRPPSSTRSARSTPACAFVNALPVFIACDPEWAAEVRGDAGVPIIGDDIKSQVGATITHRVLAKLFEDRGVVAGPHVPAQRRRQHGLQEHARARPAGVQEDLQDPGRHQQHAATTSARATCTSARATTCSGSTTASGPTSGSRAARSATCR